MEHSNAFACDMAALSSEQRARHNELGVSLRSMLVAVREVSGGYEFEFPMTPATYDALTQLTPLEHACCPFFSIGIVLRQSTLLWRLTGSEGVKQFIRQEFETWFAGRPL